MTKIFAALLGGFAAIALCHAGEVAPIPAVPIPDDIPKPSKPPAITISEAELQRVAVAPSKKMPWVGKSSQNRLPAEAKPKVEKPAGSPGQDSPMDMNSGDLIIQFNGPFTSEKKSDGPPGSPPNKESMTITKDVVIEMVQANSVLRAQNVVVVRDIKTGDTELLDAKGGVQLVSPERTGRGEMMRYETKKAPSTKRVAPDGKISEIPGELIKSKFILVGDKPNQKKATLWLKKDPKDPSKKDVIQAFRFERDEVAGTFQALGAPTAVLTMDPPAPIPGAPTPAPAAKPASGGQGSGLSLDMSGGGKISMSCENEIFFNGQTGKLQVKHNAVLIKEGAAPGEGIRICSDDAIITMEVPPPGQPTPEGAGAFSGEMKLLECFGHVEIKSGSKTILCDKMKYNMESNMVQMEMTNPADTVNIYDQNSDPAKPEGGMITIISRPLKLNTVTRDMVDAGPLKIRSYTGPAASNRGNGPTQEEVMKQQAAPADPRSKSLGGGLFGGDKKSK